MFSQAGSSNVQGSAKAVVHPNRSKHEVHCKHIWCGFKHEMPAAAQQNLSAAKANG